MNRGDVYWYTFQPPDRRRPVLILTRDSAISFLGNLTIAPITTTIRNIPSEVLLTPVDGMISECAVNLDNLQTIPKTRLGSYITHLSHQRMDEVAEALSFALGLERY